MASALNTVDLILIVLLGLGAFRGYTRGFIVEILSFVAFFIGSYLALELTIPVSNRLFKESDFFQIYSILIFIALFLLLGLAIRIGAKILKNMIDRTFFGSFDNFAGAVAGLLKSAFLLSVIFWVFESVGFNIFDNYKGETIIFQYISHIGPMIFGWLGDIFPFIRDMIDSLENIPKRSDEFVASRIF